MIIQMLHKPALKVLFLILLFSTIACNKDEKRQYQGLIPNVSVSFFLNPYTEGLLVPGDFKAYPYEGYRGVFVYCLDQQSYMAYEMACPYDFEKETAVVEFDPTTYQLVDSTCNSRFQVIDGMPVSGPATVPLKQYAVDYDFASATLHIYNGF